VCERRVCVCERERVRGGQGFQCVRETCVCVCVRERESARERVFKTMFLCVCVRCVFVCVCVRERARARERERFLEAIL